MATFEIDLERYRVVDLSFEVVPGASKDRYFEIEPDLLADRATMHHVRTHTHVGTHVEVDAHFFEGGRDVTAYDLSAFMGRAVLLDIVDATEAPLMTPQLLDGLIGAKMQTDDILICRNSDPHSLSGAVPHPSWTPEAAAWLVDHAVKMVGIDQAFRLGVDIEAGRELHRIYMGAGGTLVEFLANLDALRRDVFYFMALPYRCAVIDSGWARAIAIEEL
ncbi:MAG: cyclase family protein [Anaerolineae bacterium]|jgi:arylformamidase